MIEDAKFRPKSLLERLRRETRILLDKASNLHDLLEEIEITAAEIFARITQAQANSEPTHASLYVSHIKRKRDNQLMALQLQDDQKVTYTIGETDDAGNVTPFEGTADWTVSDPAILTVTPSDDGSSADVEAVGALGTAQVAVTVTLPDGNVVGLSDDITVVVSAPAGATITAGTPEHK